jgi:hypothetical protein
VLVFVAQKPSTLRRLWLGALFLLHCATAPPALLIALVALCSSNVGKAGELAAAVLISEVNCGGVLLPFALLVHTPLHALTMKMAWDRRGVWFAHR